MNIEFTLSVKPATQYNIAIEVVFPSILDANQTNRVLELVTPLVRVQKPGQGIRIRPAGATIEDAIRNLPQEIQVALVALQ